MQSWPSPDVVWPTVCCCVTAWGSSINSGMVRSISVRFNVLCSILQDLYYCMQKFLTKLFEHPDRAGDAWWNGLLYQSIAAQGMFCLCAHCKETYALRASQPCPGTLAQRTHSVEFGCRMRLCTTRITKIEVLMHRYSAPGLVLHHTE